jgi:hypothetical protein
MAKKRSLRSWLDSGAGTPVAIVTVVTAAMGLIAGCSSQDAADARDVDGGGNGQVSGIADTSDSGADEETTPDSGGEGPSSPGSPFKSLEAVANAPASFSQPRAGVPLPDGSIAFIATLEGIADEEVTRSGARVGVWLEPASGGAPSVLYAGDKLVNPFDIDVSLDGTTLYVADVAGGTDGRGAILSFAVSGGEPTELLAGWAPRGITVAPDDRVYFSGIDESSGEPGVFILAGGAVSRVFSGAPLVDPSGIAVRKDGGVLVSDTRLFDGPPEGMTRNIPSEAGIVLIKDGQPSIFATGFVTGYPAGIALTSNEQSLIISGQGPDRSDTVYIVDVAHPETPPLVVTEKFSAFQDSSGGLKRAHDSDTFIWASLSANGGTIYRIRGN